MLSPLRAVKSEVKRGLRYTAASIAATAILLAGSAFLLLALFLALATEVGPVTAATILGLSLLFIGGGILFRVRADVSHSHTDTDTDTITVGALLDAFLEGQKAGVKAQKDRD